MFHPMGEKAVRDPNVGKGPVLRVGAVSIFRIAA